MGGTTLCKTRRDCLSLGPGFKVVFANQPSRLTARARQRKTKTAVEMLAVSAACFEDKQMLAKLPVGGGALPLCPCNSASTSGGSLSAHKPEGRRCCRETF